ncbi:MAG: hypothetical protein K0R82_448 [Flavipsychrobacter sp.]|jgi:hypothetical protein|nr:hypothetical protein [Flavipsychrobacter sp.]
MCTKVTGYETKNMESIVDVGYVSGGDGRCIWAIAQGADEGQMEEDLWHTAESETASGT